ncbi:hypothetical protein ANO11243_009930 [Dothideomycetidae sp. 11243]|nr:hypothetical protein ANO11243_009930 [fungal sp. No.11243]
MRDGGATTHEAIRGPAPEGTALLRLRNCICIVIGGLGLQGFEEDDDWSVRTPEPGTAASRCTRQGGAAEWSTIVRFLEPET